MAKLLSILGSQAAEEFTPGVLSAIVSKHDENNPTASVEGPAMEWTKVLDAGAGGSAAECNPVVKIDPNDAALGDLAGLVAALGGPVGWQPGDPWTGATMARFSGLDVVETGGVPEIVQAISAPTDVDFFGITTARLKVGDPGYCRIIEGEVETATSGATYGFMAPILPGAAASKIFKLALFAGSSKGHYQVDLIDKDNVVISSAKGKVAGGMVDTVTLNMDNMSVAQFSTGKILVTVSGKMSGLSLNGYFSVDERNAKSGALVTNLSGAGNYELVLPFSMANV